MKHSHSELVDYRNACNESARRDLRPPSRVAWNHLQLHRASTVAFLHIPQSEFPRDRKIRGETVIVCSPLADR